ncbi:gastrula zinc finger protein XlCGF8.2DB-like isoform X1 [Synchiropus splendidus]|uniref:gastrula zinc finger protein XlCGF8.2DB-like isoform X1 n=1 Tax=Synchiropus splendidus TaxID=270530 RepID=UPI00237E3610|nr:gastrula zinc finger protein XlCGF8.2DB-like isoform X1 [Synchiropus splendidus]
MAQKVVLRKSPCGSMLQLRAGFPTELSDESLLTSLLEVKSTLVNVQEDSRRLLPGPVEAAVRTEDEEVESQLLHLNRRTDSNPHTGFSSLPLELEDNVNVNHRDKEPGRSSTARPQSAQSSYSDSDDDTVEIKCSSRKKSNCCSECGKMYSCPRSLNQHKKIHSGEKPFRCPECGKRFGFKGDLKKHLQIHSEPQQTCSVCNKTFLTKESLSRHFRRLHIDEKPFSCSVCKRTYALRDYLTRHMRVHTGELPYTCSVCLRGFQRKYNLVQHIRIHTGERPYTCPHCLTGFRLRGGLNQHLQIHSGEKRYPCSDCEKRFTTTYRLRLHKRKVHNVEVTQT